MEGELESRLRDYITVVEREFSGRTPGVPHEAIKAGCVYVCDWGGPDKINVLHVVSMQAPDYVEFSDGSVTSVKTLAEVVVGGPYEA